MAFQLSSYTRQRRAICFL